MQKLQGEELFRKLNFENIKHHRQLLREKIKPELFQRLEISENPAANYINAYKNIYKDELEKTIEQINSKKAKEEHQHINEKFVYSLNHSNGNSPLQQSFSLPAMQTQTMPKGQSQPYSQLEGNNNYQALSHKKQKIQINQSKVYQNSQSRSKPRFRDYFEERTNRIEDHIKSNFDCGQSFFKVQDAYVKKKMKQTQNYADFLKRQLQQKEQAKINLREKQNSERQMLKNQQKHQMQLQNLRIAKETEIKQYLNFLQQQEVQLERNRRQRKSKKFQYNKIGLHNPITNPIEFYIDNPYILKKIQDKTFR